jgi:hypothetical protein
MSGAAEQRVQGLPGALAEKIPQGDLDPGEGIDHRTVSPHQMQRVQDFAAQPVDVAGVAAHDEWRDDVVERCPGGRDRGVPERLPPADEAVFGFDPHQQYLQVRPRLAGEKRRWAAHIAWDRHDTRLD